jgi:hypothetical protein
MITDTSYKSASTPTRRRDTHANRHGARPSVARYSIRTNYSAAQLARGTDDHGRFIGPHDVERAAEHFWRAPHRRSQAPIVRADPVFDEALGARKVKVLRPRAAKSGLTPNDLVEIHTRAGQGETWKSLATFFDVGIGTIAYHFRKGGSVAMRAALTLAARQKVLSAAA